MQPQHTTNQQHQPLQQLQQDSTIFNLIINYLNENKIPYQLLQHTSSSTSEQSAITRNTPLEWGSKTMLIYNKSAQITMLLYRANTKLSWNKIKKIQSIGKKSKMLTKQQLYQKFKLLPGAVPPFANIMKINGIVDQKFEKYGDKMAFNAGLRNKSIVMNMKDFKFQLNGFENGDITQNGNNDEVKVKEQIK